jgi:hypothetical protein
MRGDRYYTTAIAPQITSYQPSTNLVSNLNWHHQVSHF